MTIDRRESIKEWARNALAGLVAGLTVSSALLLLMDRLYVSQQLFNAAQTTAYIDKVSSEHRLTVLEQALSQNSDRLLAIQRQLERIEEKIQK